MPPDRPPPLMLKQTTERLAPRALRPMLVVSMTCLLVWIAVAIPRPDLHHIIPFQVVALVAMTASLLLVRSGNTRAAAIVFCSVIWILCQFPPFVNGRLGVPTISLPTLVVLSTAVLWSTRVAIGMAVGTSVIWLIAMLGIQQGIVVSDAPVRTDFQFWLALTEILAVASMGLLIVDRALRGALVDNARHSADLAGAAEALTPIVTRGPEDREERADPVPHGPGDAPAPTPLPDGDMELVGRLAGGIAHDFNNLLTVVGGATELIEDDPDATDSILELAGQIRVAQERAAVITRRLLAFAQRQIVETGPIAVGPLVKSHVPFLRRFLGPSVTVDLAVTNEDTTVLFSVVELEQILLNLATNARDAIDGIGPISVRVDRRILSEPLPGPAGTASPGDYVVISVEDAGRGMGPEVARRVFEPFFSSYEQSVGRGLGLSAVLGMVQRSGGQVVIESAEGRGTLVEVLLPLSVHLSPVVH